VNRVFAVQNQMRRDTQTGELVPKFPLMRGEAARYGELEFLLSPGAAPWTPSVIPEMRQKLASYDADRDWLLLVGNPALIGYAVALASRASGGRLRLLQWSGRGDEKKYIPIEVDLDSGAPRRVEDR
jgi:hypothetical protein